MSTSSFATSVAILSHKLSAASTMEEGKVTSPLSIAYILSLLQLGSSGNTQQQLIDLFGFDENIETLIQIVKIFNTDIIRLANTIIVNNLYPLKQDYSDIVNKAALISNEDFNNNQAIVTKVNNFISANTNNLINDILKPEHINTDTTSVLINTIYFKSLWKVPFEPHLNYKAAFNKISECTMMRTKSYFSYYEDGDVQIVELPYVNKDYCMGFVLPKNNDVNCHKYLMNAKYEKQYIDARIPKFTQRCNIDLISVLSELGLVDIFTPNAALDKMCDGAKPYVGVMIHEAVVIVSETGTEAAAVTVAVCTLGSCCIGPKAIIFNADHTFAYYIKHYPSNMPLFVGKYSGL